MSLFHVSIHDVAPPWRGEIGEILAALGPRVGPALSLAVVPAWYGTPLDARRHGALIDLVRGSGAELHLHGLHHRRDRGLGGLRGLLTEGSNELGGLGRAEARARLGRGRELLAEALGQAPTGLVPPTFDAGPVDARLLGELGLDHLITLGRARSASGGLRLLSTCSWDTGRFSALGALGEGFGRAVEALAPWAVPHVVFHPRDVARGWMGRALGRVDELLRRGLVPSRWGAIFARGGSR